MAVTGVETAIFKENKWIGLAASKSTSSVEIEIVNMNVAIVMCGSDFWAKKYSLCEHLGAFSAELEHFAHGRVAINVSIATLDVRVFRSVSVRNGAVDVH